MIFWPIIAQEREVGSVNQIFADFDFDASETRSGLDFVLVRGKFISDIFTFNPGASIINKGEIISERISAKDCESEIWPDNCPVRINIIVVLN